MKNYIFTKSIDTITKKQIYLISMNKLYITILLCLFSPFVMANPKKSLDIKSSYIETIDNFKLEKNLVKDYGAISSKTKDQSTALQSAIDDVSKHGGGKLFIPKGTYFFKGVKMKSNVHILVEDGTLFKPYWGKDTKMVMFSFSGDDKNNPQKYIQNCSIRCATKGGSYIVDYSDTNMNDRLGIRFIVLSMVKNFYLADMDIRDNFTVYCGMTFAPTSAKSVSAQDALKWEVSRPTNGEIRNCKITDANPGYGLLQIHGANDLYFEDIYAKGGVTLRLETGAKTKHIGVFNIKAKKVVNENGRCAVMMAPHISQNGTILIDGILSKSSTVALSASKGFTSGKHKDEVGAVKGRFADDSKVINIHAIYGTDCQIKKQALYQYQPDMIKMFSQSPIPPKGKWVKGPSLSAVTDSVEDWYGLEIENVTWEGFPASSKMILYPADSAKREKDKWKIADMVKANK